MGRLVDFRQRRGEGENLRCPDVCDHSQLKIIISNPPLLLSRR